MKTEISGVSKTSWLTKYSHFIDKERPNWQGCHLGVYRFFVSAITQKSYFVNESTLMDFSTSNKFCFILAAEAGYLPQCFNLELSQIHYIRKPKRGLLIILRDIFCYPWTRYYLLAGTFTLPVISDMFFCKVRIISYITFRRISN